MLLAPFPGGFASRNPRAVVLAGGGCFRAGSEGVTPARFGWANPITGFVENVFAEDTQLGFIAPVPGHRRSIPAIARLLPPGDVVTLFSKGDFWAVFADGAEPGTHVYASQIDGTPIAAYVAPVNSVLTPWVVVVGTEPGGLAVISTWSNFL